MAARSVIDIDVNDEKFKDFLALYEKYQAQLATSGGKWELTEEAAQKTAGSFGQMTAALMAQAELLHRHTLELREQDKVEDEAGKKRRAAEKAEAKASADRARASKKQIDDIKAMASGVAGITVSLLKWASLGTVFSGLIGAGGLFGIDRLADSVSDARRAAQGIGVTSGQQQAFGLNFGRFVNANEALENVANAQSDLSKRWVFSAMGLNPSGRNPAELAIDAQLRAKAMFEQGGGTQQYAEATGLTQLFSMDELRRLKATSAKDLEQAKARYEADAKTLALQDDVQKRWQDFSFQMHRAGLQIQNTFVRGLDPLIDPLQRLSQAAAQSVETLLTAAADQGWIDKLADGLKDFAGYVASDKFQEDVKDFVGNMSLIEQGVLNLLRILHLIPQEKTDVQVNQGGHGVVETDARGRQTQWLGTSEGLVQVIPANTQANFVKPYSADQIRRVAGLVSSSSRYDAYFQAAGAKYGVDWRELKLRGAIESSLKPGLTGPQTLSGQAIGIMQVNAHAHGLSDASMMDPERNIDVGARIYAEALRKAAGSRHGADAIYYGSPGKPNSEQYANNGDAVRAYLRDQAIKGVVNQLKGFEAGGALTLDQLIARYDTKKPDSLAADIAAVVRQTGIAATQKVGASDSAALAKIATALQGIKAAKPSAPAPATVIVRNATGGSAVVSTNQLAH